MKDVEELEVYDVNKKKTGKFIIRHKYELRNGEYIVGVQAIIINSKNEILISQRSREKSKYPLKWECNGGAIRKGEDEISGIIREIYEELGIVLTKEETIFLKTIKKNHHFKTIFLFKMDIKIEDIKFIDKEVVDVKWVSIDEFMNMFNNGEIVPNVDFDENDFYKSLMLIK